MNESESIGACCLKVGSLSSFLEFEFGRKEVEEAQLESELELEFELRKSGQDRNRTRISNFAFRISNFEFRPAKTEHRISFSIDPNSLRAWPEFCLWPRILFAAKKSPSCARLAELEASELRSIGASKLRSSEASPLEGLNKTSLSRVRASSLRLDSTRLICFAACCSVGLLQVAGRHRAPHLLNVRSLRSLRSDSSTRLTGASD